MIVFSNTTPFIALSCINRLQILPELFGEIHVAASVIVECADGGRIFVPDLAQLRWIVQEKDSYDINLPILFELDRGEKQTIALAMKIPGSIVLIDEKIGRNIAEYVGLQVTGTLGVLGKAKKLGLIPSFKDAAMDMIAQGIRYNRKLIDKICIELGE